eukprot:468588-Rhodomonas_salina.3
MTGTDRGYLLPGGGNNGFYGSLDSSRYTSQNNYQSLNSSLCSIGEGGEVMEERETGEEEGEGQRERERERERKMMGSVCVQSSHPG